jgi:hypothetical protein
MTLDSALITINLVLVTVLLAMLIWRRVYRALPVFVTYAAYSVLLGFASLACTASTPDYLLVWSVGIMIDTLFYLCVLMELGSAVLRYNRASPLRWGLVLLLFLAASVPIGLLTPWPDVARYKFVYQLNIRGLQATAILEIAALLTMAWWSGFKKLHWPERELRIVMGMGSWALVQLCVLILHEHGLLGPGYHWLDFLTPATTLGVFIYWLHYFWLAGAGDSHHSNRTCVAAQE